jgi:hypothetical protein
MRLCVYGVRLGSAFVSQRVVTLEGCVWFDGIGCLCVVDLVCQGISKQPSARTFIRHIFGY